MVGDPTRMDQPNYDLPDVEDPLDISRGARGVRVYEDDEFPGGAHTSNRAEQLVRDFEAYRNPDLDFDRSRHVRTQDSRETENEDIRWVEALENDEALFIGRDPLLREDDTNYSAVRVSPSAGGEIPSVWYQGALSLLGYDGEAEYDIEAVAVPDTGAMSEKESQELERRARQAIEDDPAEGAAETGNLFKSKRPLI